MSSSMNSISIQRVKRELKEVITSEEVAKCQIRLELANDSFNTLHGEIGGPANTPYEGGTFKLELIIPDSYPFTPPKVKFLTKIWHPNISSATGAICLDILKDQWVAALSLRTVLLSLQSLLTSAEPTDPQDAVVAKQYIKHKDIFKATATYWTSAFAGGTKKNGEYDHLVASLVEMGLSRQQAITSLSNHNWELDVAINDIFP